MRLIIAFTLALLSTASAQHLPLPKTVTIVNNATKEVIGTMTITGSTTYLRDKAGELQATVVVNPDGTKTVYDPDGKILKVLPVPAAN